jgi:hypothetical protein
MTKRSFIIENYSFKRPALKHNGTPLARGH